MSTVDHLPSLRVRLPAAGHRCRCRCVSPSCPVRSSSSQTLQQSTPISPALHSFSRNDSRWTSHCSPVTTMSYHQTVSACVLHLKRSAVRSVIHSFAAFVISPISSVSPALCLVVCLSAFWCVPVFVLCPPRSCAGCEQPRPLIQRQHRRARQRHCGGHRARWCALESIASGVRRADRGADGRGAAGWRRADSRQRADEAGQRQRPRISAARPVPSECPLFVSTAPIPISPVSRLCVQACLTSVPCGLCAVRRLGVPLSLCRDTTPTACRTMSVRACRAAVPWSAPCLSVQRRSRSREEAGRLAGGEHGSEQSAGERW